MAEETDSSATRRGSGTAQRPQFTSTIRSSSFLREHQQYRPPHHPEGRFGINTVVEDLGRTSVSPPPKTYATFRGVPNADSPPTVIESGINHAYSHPNCVPASTYWSSGASNRVRQREPD